MASVLILATNATNTRNNGFGALFQKKNNNKKTYKQTFCQRLDVTITNPERRRSVCCYSPVLHVNIYATVYELQHSGNRPRKQKREKKKGEDEQLNKQQLTSSGCEFHSANEETQRENIASVDARLTALVTLYRLYS